MAVESSVPKLLLVSSGVRQRPVAECTIAPVVEPSMYHSELVQLLAISISVPSDGEAESPFAHR